jgi:tetratricopeptide (TPR) repeat protein
MRRILPYLFFWLLAVSLNAQKVLTETQRIEFDKHFFNGMREKLINNYVEAENEFRLALAINYESANLHYQLASILEATKRFDECLQEAENAVKFDPANPWYINYLADRLKAEKRYLEAAKVCEQGFKKTNDLQFLMQKSAYEMMAYDYPAALKTIDHIEKIVGIKEAISRQKEEIYLAINKPQKAVEEIRKLCKAYPEDLNFKGLLADLLIATGKDKEAVALYEEILRKEPNNGYALFALADFYKSKGDKERYFEMVKKGMVSPIEVNLKVKMLSIIIPSQDFAPQHLERCETLIQLFVDANSSNSEPYLFKGDLFLQKQNFEEARQWYQKATEMDPFSIIAWEQSVFCDQQLQRFDWMKVDAEKMMQYFPLYPNSHYYHSLACRRLKEFTIALKSAREGVAVSEDEESLINMLTNLGTIAHYAGNYTLADSSFEAVLALDPINALALNNYAYFLSLRNDNLDKAENMSKKSLELNPESSSYLDTYAWILYMKGNYAEAKIQIERALSLSPNSAEVVEHYGDICYRLGEKERAMNQWKKALELGSDSEELKKKVNTGLLP